MTGIGTRFWTVFLALQNRVFLSHGFFFCFRQLSGEIGDFYRNAPAYAVGDSDKGAFSSDAILAQHLLSISAGVVMPRR